MSAYSIAVAREVQSIDHFVFCRSSQLEGSFASLNILNSPGDSDNRREWANVNVKALAGVSFKMESDDLCPIY